MESITTMSLDWPEPFLLTTPHRLRSRRTLLTNNTISDSSAATRYSPSYRKEETRSVYFAANRVVERVAVPRAYEIIIAVSYYYRLP